MAFRSRKYVFTLNNWTESDTLYLAGLPTRYLCYGKEHAPTTNTPHLQGFVYWNHPRTLRASVKLLRGCHVESARGSFTQCIDYCSKGGDFFEQGSRPSDPSDNGDREVTRWNTALEAARSGALDEIDPQILISHYGSLTRIATDSIVIPVSLPTTTGYWIIGQSGSGKSRGIREMFPELYPKPLNKWWDGYRNQETVLVDDVDNSHSQWIGGFLKIWGDHYGFIAEAKGKSVPIRPTRVIVTSQYSIRTLFSNDSELVEALERRFMVIECTRGQPLVFPSGITETEEER